MDAVAHLPHGDAEEIGDFGVGAPVEEATELPELGEGEGLWGGQHSGDVK